MKPLRLAYLITFLVTTTMATAQVRNHLYAVHKTHTDGYKTIYEYGYVNDSGRLVIPYQYRFADAFKNGYARVTEDNRSGLIDTNGHLIAPFIFTDILPWQHLPYWTGKVYPDSIVVLGVGGKVICQGYGQSALGYADIDRIIINNDRELHGPGATVFDFEGHKIFEVKSPPKHYYQVDAIEQDYVPYKNHKALRLVRDRTDGAIIDMRGNMLIDSVSSVGFYGGYMVLTGPTKACVVDTNMKFIIPVSASYQNIARMEPAHYLNVMKNGLWGITDLKGKVVIPCRYVDRAQQHNDAQFIVYDKDKKLYTSYDYTGKELFTSKESIHIGFSQNRFPVPMKKAENVYQLWKDGYIGVTHEFISGYNDEGYAYCYDKGVKSIIDSNGNVVFTTTLPFLTLPDHGTMGAGTKVPCPACEDYNCALQAISDKEAYAKVLFYIDMKGKKLFNDTFERIEPFRDGQATVTRHCGRYAINTKGENILARQGSTIVTATASGARIVADKDGRQALTNADGKLLTPWVTSFRKKEGQPVSYYFFETTRAEYNGGGQVMLPDFKDGLIVFQQGDKYGLMDSTGAVIMNANYKSIRTEFGSYYKITTTDDKEGALDKKGKILIAPEYTRVDYNFDAHVFILEKNKDDIPIVFIDMER